MISPHVTRDVLTNYQKYKNLYKKIFTYDQELIKLDPEFFEYCFPGSNYPWTPRDEFEIHKKSKLVSFLSSGKNICSGHAARLDWGNRLNGSVDFYGGIMGSAVIGGSHHYHHNRKTEALKDYMFSIAIENCKMDTYFTEKLTDCFANGTIPVYFGADSIGSIFNPDGIIVLDDNFDISLLNEELYYSKLQAVRDNFEIVKNMPLADEMLYRKIIKKLPNVTLFAADSVNPELAVQALKESSKHIEFGKIILFSHIKPFNLPENFEFCQIPRLRSGQDYSSFILNRLNDHITTDFCLSVHCDGYIINPDKWTDEFLNYDYIGSPWPIGGPANLGPERVGNGGVSLRSKKLLSESSVLRLTNHEDVVICCINRQALESKGINFAPLSVAAIFSSELHCPDLGINPETDCLAFHGKRYQKYQEVKNKNLLDLLNEDGANSL